MKDNFSGEGNMWDERFSNNKNLYTTHPNAHFANFLKDLKPGKILLPGDGEGRNGVFAAKLGWDVTTFDYSEVAIYHTQELAKENGVKIQSFHTSIEAAQFANKAYDVIAIIFLHLPPHIRSVHFPRLVQFLKDGGHFYLLGFNKKQINLSSGGPKNEAMLFNTIELKEDFSALNVLKLDEFQFELDEGPKHQGKAEMIEFVGLKLLKE